jgi:hypothetical protein
MLTFLLVTVALSSAGASAVLILSLLVLVAIFGSLFTLMRLPQSLARFFLMVRRCGKNPRVRVQGIRNLPEAGGALLVGYGCGDDDWALLQIASPRFLKLVVQKDHGQGRYLTWWFRFCRALAVGPGPLEPSSVADIVKLLDNKQVVYKQLNSGSSPDNKRDVEGARLQAEVQQICAAAAKEVVIIPYSIQRYGGHHAYVVAFGHTEPTTIPWELLQQKLQSLASAARREYDKGGSNAGQCFPNS